VRALFIDPASWSTGWAYFVNGQYADSGTIAVPKPTGKTRISAEERIRIIHDEYKELNSDLIIDEVHIEKFGGRPSHMLHWAVGAIAVAFDYDVSVRQDIPVKSWQKFAGWNSKGKKLKVGKQLKPYLQLVHSEDQLAAIGMGMYWNGRE
jgi:Holliday junction resolvasome RuvABC endonuclease subunit